MNKREIEEKYIDVLHNIEFGIVSVYRESDDLTDWEALRAVEALISHYQAERANKPPRSVVLKPLAQEVFDRVRSICEMMLGRQPMIVEREEKVLGIFPIKKQKELTIQPKTVDEILLCLKRVRDSIQFWTKESGRQGYLTYIDQFVV